MIDGILAKSAESYDFHEVFLSPDDIVDTQERIQQKVLALFGRKGWINPDEIEKMMDYENSGFSLNAEVRIPAWDRDGLERLIRYCARPPFANENLRWNGPWLSYSLPKPCHTGKTYL